jgi:hypothetical protein
MARRTHPRGRAAAVVASAAAVAAVVVGVSFAGSSVASEEAGPLTTASSELPAAVGEPAASGSSSAASFAAFLATVRSFLDGTPSPRPDDAAGLVDWTDASVSGTVASVALEPVTVSTGGLEAARLDLVIELDDLEIIEAAAGVDLTTWTKTVWMGDPELADAMADRLRAELGPGPVGADAVLFGNVVHGVLGVFDGVIDDGTTVARVSVVRAQPDGDLSSAEAAQAGADG